MSARPSDQPATAAGRGSIAYEPCPQDGHSHDWRDCPTPEEWATTTAAGRGSIAYEPCPQDGHSHDWRDCPTPEEWATTTAAGRGSIAYEPCPQDGHSHDWRDCPTPEEWATTTAAQRVVFKYAMTQPVMRVLMPGRARIIDVQTQNGTPCLWAICSNEHDPEEREFVAFGTGHAITESDLEYVGSAHDVEGQGLVFHIFERPIR
jgi:hypothetical protein